MGRSISSSDAATRLEAATQNKLLMQLRALSNQKPKETSPVSMHDEFHLKLKEMYIEIISRFPVFAVDNKLELEMWNTLYKVHIDTLQNLLHPRPTASTNFAGQSPNTMKLKLQFLLILDRAAGVYLTLIQRLLHSIPDTCWPKSLLGAVTSYAAPTGMHKFARLGRTSGRFDLDLATFSALQHFGTTVSQGSLRCLDDKQEMDTLVTAPVAPRILSRGDRLPSQDALSSEASNPLPASITSPTNHTTDVSQTGLFPSFPAPPTSVDRESAVNYLTQHCLVHLGDIARYRHQFNVAAGFYIWAWIVHPESGHPFNQLAILQSSKVPRKPVDTSMYYYIRAIACQCPFPAANTNLKNLLRTHPIQSHSSTSSVRPVRDACQLLTDLYVALSLEAESSVLVSLANEFVLSSSSPDPVWSAADDRRLLRLVTIHVYLLATHLENYSEETRSSSQPENECTKTSVIHTILLHVTVALIDWIAAQYLADCPNQAPNKRSLLPCIVLLFLWLRLQTTHNSVSLDAAFRTYAPPLSENVLMLLKELSNANHPSDITQLSSVGALLSPRTTCFELNWPELLRLPELSLLEGFQPLQIPTQRKLCFTKGYAPSFPFPNGLHSQNRLLDLIQLLENPPFQVNGLINNQIGDSALVLLERARFILCSARIVAHHFPALLGWVEELFDEVPSTSLSLNGRFRPVTRPAPVLSELLPLSYTKPALVTSISSVDPHTTADSTEDQTVGACPSSYASCQDAMDDLINPKHLPSSPTAELCRKYEKVTFADNVPAEDSSAHVNGEQEVPYSPLAPVESLTNSGLPPSKDTNVPSASTSGGLIVNAELAKFIQEQASQVAARQQLAGLSTGACTTTGNVINDDASHITTSGTTVGKGAKSRPFVSTAFRRDLPPRFARRLQAELLEREALEQRLGRRKTTGPDSCKNFPGIGALNLDQPAPLARKESEAPYELNSLLSGADSVPSSATGPGAHHDVLESTALSSTPFLTPHLPVNSALLQPFMNSYQNASLNVASRSHSMQPLPVYQTHSMPLAPVRPSALHESTTFPGASTIYGQSQHIAPTPVLDWRTQAASFTPAQPGDYQTTHLVAPQLSTFSSRPNASTTDMLSVHYQCAENGQPAFHEDGSHFTTSMPFHSTSNHFYQVPSFISAPSCFTAGTCNSNCVSHSMWLDGTTMRPNRSPSAAVSAEQPFECNDVP